MCLLIQFVLTHLHAIPLARVSLSVFFEPWSPTGLALVAGVHAPELLNNSASSEKSERVNMCFGEWG